MDPASARLECLKLACDTHHAQAEKILGAAKEWSQFVIGETPKESKSAYGKGADDPKK